MTSAILPVQDLDSNIGLRVQCAMMLDGFPSAVTAAIEAARADLPAITKIIAEQPDAMISGYFAEERTRDERVQKIAQFIHAFFAYRASIGK